MACAEHHCSAWGSVRFMACSPANRTKVILTSQHRVSTRLNVYADFWAGLIMRSIQRNILEIVRARAEAGRGSV